MSLLCDGSTSSHKSENIDSSSTKRDKLPSWLKLWQICTQTNRILTHLSFGSSLSSHMSEVIINIKDLSRQAILTSDAVLLKINKLETLFFFCWCCRLFDFVITGTNVCRLVSPPPPFIAQCWFTSLWCNANTSCRSKSFFQQKEKGKNTKDRETRDERRREKSAAADQDGRRVQINLSVSLRFHGSGWFYSHAIASPDPWLDARAAPVCYSVNLIH